MITTIIIFIISASLAGILAGLLGKGGGVILVPLILFVLPQFGVEHNVMQIALATSLSCIIITASISARAHYNRGSVNIAIVKAWVLPAIIGAIIGSYWASSADEYLLRTIYISVLSVVLGYRMLKPNNALFAEHNIYTKGLICPFIVGTIASTMGIGGGNNVPLLSLFGIKMQQAVGIASALGVFIALPSVVVYIYTGINTADLPSYNIGFVNIPMFLAIVPITALMAPVGVYFSHKITHNTLNTVWISVTIILIANMARGMF